MIFLNSVVSDIIERFSDNMDNIKVIFPIKRTQIFFEKEFQKFKNYKNSLPEGIVFDEWVSQESHIARFGKIPLMFKLFDAYNKIPQPMDARLPFERFYDWGGMILNDFNTIDEYLINPKELFSNLEKHAKIEKDDEHKELFKKYLSFWEILEALYENLTEMLNTSRGSYSGWIKREFLNIIKNSINSKYTYIFVGFSKLTPVEEAIINIFIKRGQGKIYWNLDSYYIENETQESGDFIRKYMNRNGKNISFIYDSFKKPKDIEIYSLSSKTSEAKFVSEVLTKLKNESDFFYESTSIILGDESLLPALLNSIPYEDKNNEDNNSKKRDRVNIALSYPFEETPLYSFIDLIIQLHEHPFQTNYDGFYYYKDVINILTHPYFQLLIKNSEDSSGKNFDLYKKMVLENQTHLTYQELLKSIDIEFRDVVSTVFFSWSDVKEMLNHLERLISLLKVVFISNKEEFKLHLEYLFHFNQILQQFYYALEYTVAKIRVRTFWNIFHEMLKETFLPFGSKSSEKYSDSDFTDGVQFMNFNQFEGLDFKNVVILSANERVIPKSRKNSTFLMYETRKYFGLPTYEDDDAHDAYKFYSLIQHAEKVYILYHTDDKSEKSRFIEQLLSEDISKISQINEPITVSFNTKLTKLNPISSIDKNYFVMSELKGKNFSPTSLNVYLECQLKFYYHYILGIKPPKKIEDSPDRALVGTIIHNFLHDFYKKNLNISSGNIFKSSFEDFYSKIEAKIGTKIEEIYKSVGKIRDISRGKNRTNLFAIKKMISSFFKIEYERESFKVLEVEKRLVLELAIDENFIQLKGFIDRLDQTIDGETIIDYKTTTKKTIRKGIIGDKSGVDLDNWHIYPSYMESEHFQLLFYGYLYHKLTGKKDFKTGIYFLAQPERGFETLRITSKLKKEIEREHFIFTKENLEKIESMITNILNSIFDKNTPFIEATDKKACQYCDYFIFCGRKKE